MTIYFALSKEVIFIFTVLANYTKKNQFTNSKIKTFFDSQSITQNSWKKCSIYLLLSCTSISVCFLIQIALFDKNILVMEFMYCFALVRFATTVKIKNNFSEEGKMNCRKMFRCLINIFTIIFEVCLATSLDFLYYFKEPVTTWL